MRSKKTMWVIIILGLIFFIFLEGLTFARFGQKKIERIFFSHLLHQYEESMKKAKEIPDSEFLLCEGKIYNMIFIIQTLTQSRSKNKTIPSIKKRR